MWLRRTTICRSTVDRPIPLVSQLFKTYNIHPVTGRVGFIVVVGNNPVRLGNLLYWSDPGPRRRVEPQECRNAQAFQFSKGTSQRFRINAPPRLARTGTGDLPIEQYHGFGSIVETALGLELYEIDHS